MTEVINWILSGLVGILIMILGYVLKMLIVKFDEMIKSINTLNKTIALQAQRLEQGEKEFKSIHENINGLQDNLKTHIEMTDVRFDNVEKRVLQIEITDKIQHEVDMSKQSKK
jgi:predicted PurR-regulated permease PerM